jgi:hypothetical protein
MKATISLERDRIKLKECGRQIIIPLDLKEGKLWMESLVEDQETKCLYEINNEQNNYIELTAEEEYLKESPMSVGHNFDSSLYNWKIKNYETHAKDCFSIEFIPKKHLKTCYSI